MTLNQISSEIRQVLQNHALLNTVIKGTPVEWINRQEVPTYPVGSFDISSGLLNTGREQIYRIDIWMLDQSGKDGEFEDEVISDMHGVAYDVLAILRKATYPWQVSNQAQWQAISEKFEDYLSGVRISFDISVVRDYGACDTPTT